MKTMRWAVLVCAVVVAASMTRNDDAALADITGEPVPISIVPDSRLMMTSPRAVHAAASLNDGRVALIGGCTEHSCEPGPGSATVDIYDPKSGRFSSGGALTMPRIGAAAVTLDDGRVLIAGGWAGSRTTASVELYDPGTRTSTRIGELARPRADIGAVKLIDGRVALIGGMDDEGSVGDVALFDPRTRQLSAGPPLGVARASAAAVRLADGRVLVVGGGERGVRMRPSAVVEIADARLTGWTRGAALKVARYKHAVVALAGGGALVVGGSDARDREGKIAVIEAFEPERGTFAEVGRTVSLRYKIANAVVALADGRVLIGGGGARPEVFDPRTRQSALLEPSIGSVLNFASASLLPNGRVLIAGGYEENSIAVTRGAWLIKP